MRGVVELVEPLGRHVLAHARVGETRVIASLDTRDMPRVGETIDLAVRAGAEHYFDAKTGERLPERGSG
jgi:hypothetical protein